MQLEPIRADGKSLPFLNAPPHSFGKMLRQGRFGLGIIHDT
jgi:hypothetical protein